MLQTVKLQQVCHLTRRPRAFCKPKLRLQRSPSGASHEGIGLSVTYCTDDVIEAWEYIARLGGTKKATLRRRDNRPGHFVLYSRALEKSAINWAVSAGLLTAAVGYEVSWFDDELNDRMSAQFSSRQDAEDEMLEYEEYGAKISAVTIFHAARELVVRWQQHFSGNTPITPEHAVVEATNIYVTSAYPQFDGVWWEDRLSPETLSAPRGVILPHAIGRWTADC